MAGRGPEGVARLARIAAGLGRTAIHRKPAPDWPHLWLFTDPIRTPDALAAAALPRGSGVVLRTFGRSDIEAAAPALAAMARAQGLMLLVGAEEVLAARIRADGLHLPERLMARLPRLKARHPAWRFTVAVHGERAVRAAADAGADAVFLSPVLPSLSPSAGPPIGPTRTAALARSATVPVYGLGGIDGGTASRLRGVGLVGVAGVGFASRART